ncbi:MAG: YHS domain-containing protein [Oscillochloris sp.]|nr:YHS domain-containing protein [Oscillochloris sp.]
MFDDFYLKAAELQKNGQAFATATVVRAERPTSGKPGDKAIITADGTMYGWIGGSCAQPTVVREAQQALADGASRLIRLSPDPQAQTPRPGLRDVAMNCFSGGTLEIFIEPQQPRPRLLIVGNLPAARALAELGRAMNYQVVMIDPAHTSDAHSDEPIITDLRRIPQLVSGEAYAVVATHGQYDEPALEQLLQTPARYIGLVASRRRGDEVRTYLAGLGIEARALERLRAPAGLHIGARRGDEIALSIMAEIVQLRYAASDQAEITTPPSPAAVAIDPVCHMEVAITDAQHRHAHAGTLYYFCCPGCKGRFARNPAKFLTANSEV